MGCPDIYYLRALQVFAYALAYPDNKLAKAMENEESFEVLEEYISSKKQSMESNQFFYDAGYTAKFILDEADEEDGIEGFNACLGGVNRFIRFLGLKDND